MDVFVKSDLQKDKVMKKFLKAEMEMEPSGDDSSLV